MIRLIAGMAVIYQSFLVSNVILGILGSMLLLQGVFNLGCTGVSCMTANSKSMEASANEIQFEEIK